MFGNIGILEISIIALILLVLFGAKRIPTLFASFGQGIREFKKTFDRDAIDEGDPLPPLSSKRDTDRVERPKA